MTVIQSEGSVSPDDVVPDYVAQRSFKFAGHKFVKGDPITVSVYRHKRFESLVNTGLIKAVRR
jgi:hypothetical protein